MDIAALVKIKPKIEKSITITHKKTFRQVMASNWQLYVMLLVPVALVIIFAYIPMYGAQMAFKKFNLVEGIWASPWVGFKWFTRFVGSTMFLQTFNK